MTAGTPQGDRQAIINHFELGITKIIVNVGVLVAGFDSDVRCIIFMPDQLSLKLGGSNV